MPDSKKLLENARAIYAQQPSIGKFSLGKAVGCTEYRARRLLAILRGEIPEPTPEPPPPPKPVLGESITEDATSKSFYLPSTRIHTLEELISHYEIDTRIWECEKFTANKWEVGAKDLHGIIQVSPLFQVKAWFKKRIAVEDAAKCIREMVEDAKKSIAPKFPAIVRKRGEGSGIMAEVSIADLHVAKLAHHEETGEDYDTKIAIGRFNDAVSHTIDDIRSRTPESICLVLGNDLFQSDNTEGTTHKGTRVDIDSRYHKSFREVLKMVQGGIDNLRQLAPVTVKMVPGNHDTLSVFHLGTALECWFHKCPDVTIDNAPTMRKYVEWGVNMLMLTHGDKGRKRDFPLLMATQQPQMFGRTKIREVHLGHWHKVGADESNGVVVRVLPSLCSADAWHSSMGFVGNIKRAETYLFHKTRGLIGTSIYSVLDGDLK